MGDKTKIKLILLEIPCLLCSSPIRFGVWFELSPTGRLYCALGVMVEKGLGGAAAG